MSRRTRLIAAPIVGIIIGLALGRSLWLHNTTHTPAAIPTPPPSPTTPSPTSPSPTTTSTYALRTQEVMATPITVEAPLDQIDEAAAIVFAIFRQVDAEMSEWKETSPLSAVNANAGIAPVAVPDELRRVIARAIEIGDLTDGAFDCTWAALWGLWDFSFSAAAPPRPPPDADIAARLPLIDYRAVRIDEAAGTVYLPRPGMLIGLGGIAKGYALDRAAAALRDAGINSFLLSAGGQVLVGDPPARGTTGNTTKGAGLDLFASSCSLCPGFVHGPWTPTLRLRTQPKCRIGCAPKDLKDPKDHPTLRKLSIGVQNTVVEDALENRGAGFPARDTRPWRIGLRDPRGPSTDFFATLDLANTSLSTTGDYEKFFLYKGTRYHHVLDPRTGRPARGVYSVTVISPDATLADALSTALMILGVERGLEIAESLSDVEVIFVDTNSLVHVSSGIAGQLQLVHPPLVED